MATEGSAAARDVDTAAGDGTGPGGLSVADGLARILDHLAAAVTTGGLTAALVHDDADAIMLIPELRA
ncbi:hypothetical protein ACFXPI_21865 [Streptomyces sp. NPDC059104]|uniref:hypothetical protein n=1 Tax=Streptomyces sp. NPDC059104 TaxID=3346729 RepID=UPI003675C8EF